MGEYHMGLGICEECGETMTIRVLEDGSIIPAGATNTCSCGSKDLRRLSADDALGAISDEESI